LGDLPNVGLVIVVDNGSQDDTGRVAREWGAMVVVEPVRGYGAACLCGLARLEAVGNATARLSDREEYLDDIKIVAFVDADCGGHPDRLPEIVASILDGEVDFVLGSRILGERESGAMHLQALLGNRLACFLMKQIWGDVYTDLGPCVRYAIRYSNVCRWWIAITDGPSKCRSKWPERKSPFVKFRPRIDGE
jgi:glycosyltransferase involved in cell wall biosynthesis